MTNGKLRLTSSQAAVKRKAASRRRFSRTKTAHHRVTRAPRRQCLLTACRLRRLHCVFHNVCTDLEPHIRADAGREAVMKAGPDTSIRNLLSQGSHIGKAMGYAGCSAARYRDLRDVLRSKRRLD